MVKLSNIKAKHVTINSTQRFKYIYIYKPKQIILNMLVLKRIIEAFIFFANYSFKSPRFPFVYMISINNFVKFYLGTDYFLEEYAAMGGI